MQVTHVARGIVALRVVEVGAAPVARLLCLGNAFAEQFLDQHLEPVAVGIGTDQLAGDFGAIAGRRFHPEVIFDRGEVEAREMEQLEPCGIGQHRLEIGRVVIAVGRKADKVLVALAVADLDDAQPVADRDKTHGFGIDGHGAIGEDACGEVFFVEMHCHGRGLRRIGDCWEGGAGARLRSGLLLLPWQAMRSPKAGGPYSNPR